MTNASGRGSRRGMRMPFRQRLLLALLRVCDGSMQNADFQTLLFLYCQEAENSKLYQFVPYRCGAFSFTADADRHRLVDRGLLWVEPYNKPAKWHLTRKGRYACRGVEEERLTAFAYRYRDVRGDELIAETYRRFPYYATRSEIVERVLRNDAATRHAIEEARNRPDVSKGDGRLLTIGYEGRALEDFLNQLLRSNADILCDIRKNALSRKYGFSKKTLCHACQGLGMRYEHKRELGIASALRRDLKTQADYDRLFIRYRKTVLAQQEASLEDIRAWLRNGHIVALMCFEREARQCHRHCVAETLACACGQNRGKRAPAKPIWQGSTLHIQ